MSVPNFLITSPSQEASRLPLLNIFFKITTKYIFFIFVEILMS